VRVLEPLLASENERPAADGEPGPCRSSGYQGRGERSATAPNQCLARGGECHKLNDINILFTKDSARSQAKTKTSRRRKAAGRSGRWVRKRWLWRFWGEGKKAARHSTYRPLCLIRVMRRRFEEPPTRAARICTHWSPTPSNPYTYGYDFFAVSRMLNSRPNPLSNSQIADTTPLPCQE